MSVLTPVWSRLPPLPTALLVVSFGILWFIASRTGARTARFVVGSSLVFVLGMTPLFLSNGQGIFQFSPATGFVHFGFVEYILKFGHVDPSVEGYFMAAPSAWILHATVSMVTGVTDGPTIILWTPIFAYVVLAAVVYWVLRAMTSAAVPAAGFVGLAYFTLANIGGLLTFQASTSALITYFCVVGLLCRLETQGPGQGSAGFLLLVLLIMAMPWQHPLIATLVAAITGVAVLAKSGGRMPLAIVGVWSTAVWLVYFASSALRGLGSGWLSTALEFTRAFVLAGQRRELGSELHSMIFTNKVISAFLSLLAALVAAVIVWEDAHAKPVLRRAFRFSATTIFHGFAMGGLFHLELPIRTFVLLLAPLGAFVELAAAAGRRWSWVVMAIVAIGVPYRMVAEFGSPANLLVWSDVSVDRFIRDTTSNGLVIQGPFPKSGGYVKDPTKYEPGSYEDLLTGRWRSIALPGEPVRWAYVVFDRISFIDYAYERGRPAVYERASAWADESKDASRIYSNGNARIHFVQKDE